MKRVLLLGLSAFMLATSAQQGSAQPSLGFTSLYYLRPNLVVNSPASVAGRKDYTNAFNGTAPWGGNPDTATIVNVPLKKVSPDSLACTPVTNSLAGFYAVIFRGSCEFGAKALAAQQQGARGVIIVNNAAGLLNMGAGAVGAQVNIPVFMISQEDGAAINAQLNAGQTVTISYFRRWGSGLSNDLAIAPGSMPQPHATVIPRSQLAAGNGSPAAYRNYLGAFIANTGTATQNNVKLRATTNWYPTTGASMVVRRDSVTLTTPFPAIDSVEDSAFVMPVNFQLNPTSTGRYSFVYQVSSGVVDQFTVDNVDSVTLQVSDSIFSKGQYNLSQGTLNRFGGIRAGTPTGATSPPANFTWGPLFYMSRSNYRAAKVQFSVSGNTGVTDLAGTPDVFAYLYKWTDGAKGAPVDSIIEGAELKLVGIATKLFVTGDVSGGVFSADFFDAINDQNPAVMTDSGWYWVAVQIDNANHFISVDNRANYYTRAYAAQNNGSSRTREFWAPQVFGSTLSIDTAASGTTDTLRMFPFFERSVNNIDQLPYTFTDDADLAPSTETYTPAVALHISREPFTTSVANSPSHFIKLELFPNPATKTLSVTYDLATTASRATFHIINATGHSVRKLEVSKTKTNTVYFSVADLAAGQYYLIMGADGKSTARPFTVGVE